MFRKLKSLFKKPKETRIVYKHESLGNLVYNRYFQQWETEANPIYHEGIPGDEDGLDQESISFILEKLREIDKYYQFCKDDLLYIAGQYDSIPKNLSLKELFKVAALSLYKGYWEICFETLPDFKWLYIGMQFEGEKLVSNTIDT